MISCNRGSWLQEIFFCKEMGSIEKQTDLEQTWADPAGAFGDKLSDFCFGDAVAW